MRCLRVAGIAMLFKPYFASLVVDRTGPCWRRICRRRRRSALASSHSQNCLGVKLQDIVELQWLAVDKIAVDFLALTAFADIRSPTTLSISHFFDLHTIAHLHCCFIASSS